MINLHCRTAFVDEEEAMKPSLWGALQEGTIGFWTVVLFPIAWPVLLLAGFAIWSLGNVPFMFFFDPAPIWPGFIACGVVFTGGWLYVVWTAWSEAGHD